jgi:hypothetical protein
VAQGAEFKPQYHQKESKDYLSELDKYQNMPLKFKWDMKIWIA